MTTLSTITPCVICDDLGGDVGLELEPVGLLVEEGEEHRAEEDADRLVAAEQRDGDPGEAESGLEGRAVECASPKNAGIQMSPATPPESSIATTTILLDADAAGDRGRLRHAGRAQVEAEPGLVDHEPERHAEQ